MRNKRERLHSAKRRVGAIGKPYRSYDHTTVWARARARAQEQRGAELQQQLHAPEGVELGGAGVVGGEHQRAFSWGWTVEVCTAGVEREGGALIASTPSNSSSTRRLNGIWDGASMFPCDLR